MFTSSSTTSTRRGDPSDRVRSMVRTLPRAPVPFLCGVCAALATGSPCRHRLRTVPGASAASADPHPTLLALPPSGGVEGNIGPPGAGMRTARDDGFTAYVVGRRAQLYRTAYLLCGDRHRAEDIVQTALAKLYAAWPRASRLDSVDAYA